MTESKKEVARISLIENYFLKNQGVYTELQTLSNNVAKVLKSREVIAVLQNISIKLQEINKFLADPNIQKAFKQFCELPAKRRSAILNMSDVGWFPFEESLRVLPFKFETIDEYMIGVINANYSDLKNKLLEKYTYRKEVLEVAFKLFEEKNHIAVIPLLLTQVDGISQDNQGKYYFTGTGAREKFPNLLKERAREEWDPHTYELLSAVIDKASKTFISSRFEDIKGRINSVNILNRNGILHGDRDFLEYGEEVNTYKVFSLLLYVDWMSDMLNEKTTI